MNSIEKLVYNLVYNNLVDNSPNSKLLEIVQQAKEMHKAETEKMYSEEEVIKFGEMIAWNMVGKTITESFIRTLSKELFKQFKKD